MDARRDRNIVVLAEPLDRHAPGVVDMSRDHADRATGGAWHAPSPERRGQVLDEKDRDSVVRRPRSKDRVPEVERGRHYEPPTSLHVMPRVMNQSSCHSWHLLRRGCFSVLDEVPTITIEIFE